MEYKFDAYITWADSKRDKRAAIKLYKALSSYKLPKNLRWSRNCYKGNIYLHSYENNEENFNALKVSRFLIVICSPRTLKSDLIAEQIESFKEISGYDNILALLIEGEPQDSFPKQLIEIKDEQGHVIDAIEPLAADIRSSSLRIEKMRLLAQMIGCNFDDLRQRYRKRKAKFVITSISIISTVILVFCIFGFYEWRYAEIKRKAVQEQNDMAMELINKLYVEVPQEFSDIPEARKIIVDDILANIEEVAKSEGVDRQKLNMDAVLKVTDKDDQDQIIKKGIICRHLKMMAMSDKAFDEIGKRYADVNNIEKYVESAKQLSRQCEELGIEDGVYVQDFVPGSGAVNSNIKPGDIIYELDNKRIHNGNDLENYKNTLQKDAIIKVYYIRRNSSGKYETAITSIKLTDGKLGIYYALI